YPTAMASAPLFEALRLAYNDDVSDGYWGHKTSTLNFCEEDYAVSYYCAEVCNTFTNLLFLWLGFKDPMQMVDELSMIYTTCLMVFATFSFSKPPRFAVVLGTGLVFLAAFITFYYHMTKDPDSHSGTLLVMITDAVQVVLRSLYVMETQLRPVLTKRNGVKAQAILKTMWIMVGTGLGVFLLGFFIWNLDNAFCSRIRHWRRQLGLPWGALLEGHAWWHLMTGIGGMDYTSLRVRWR
ncbi:Alkaline ceramidase 3, partial [Colletotrichum shisoi]